MPFHPTPFSEVAELMLVQYSWGVGGGVGGGVAVELTEQPNPQPLPLYLWLILQEIIKAAYVQSSVIYYM